MSARYFFGMLLTVSFGLAPVELLAKRATKNSKVSVSREPASVAPVGLAKPVALSRVSLLRRSEGVFAICVDYFFQKNSSEQRLNFSGMEKSS